MITWFNQSKISNLLYSYIAILLGCTYFGSLAFYTLEKATNPGIKDFSDSIWWACMDVTTVGCSIEPTTPEGRILAVVLAILGMSMFPILTAYITNKFQKSINNHDHK
ncbi:MAG: potassium channel family protein [Bacteroidales bacterium]|nr:potassium channel family protein [Bacteroidales bacterium]